MGIEIVPMSWFSWNFRVLQNESPLAEIDIASWREKGLLAVGGSTYKVYREGLMSGRFVLEANGTEMASAEKPSALRRSFTVRYDDRAYELRAESAFRRTFVLLEQGVQIGSIAPTGLFTRKATVNLPAALPLPVQVFLIWLTLILWKRDSDSAAA
jgi:hypothetical protein